MDIHLHTGKAVTPLNKVLKGITSPMASRVPMVDLSRPNILFRTRTFEVAMQATVATTPRMQIADSLARGLLQIQTLLPLPLGAEVGTSKIFSGLQAMQVLTAGVVVNIISNPLRGTSLPIRRQPRFHQATTTIPSDLRRICRLRTRVRKTQGCHRLRDRNPSLRRNRSPSSASLLRPNLQTLHLLSHQRI